MGVGVSLSGLASAVANEGGVGVISCAGLGLLYREKAGDYINKYTRAKRRTSQGTRKNKRHHWSKYYGGFVEYLQIWYARQ